MFYHVGILNQFIGGSDMKINISADGSLLGLSGESDRPFIKLHQSLAFSDLLYYRFLFLSNHIFCSWDFELEFRRLKTPNIRFKVR